MKTLAKSLHTITALVQVARFVQARGILLEPSDAVDYAADILGYPSRGHDDPYTLKAAAVSKLKAEQAHAAAVKALPPKYGEALAEELARNPLRAFQ